MSVSPSLASAALPPRSSARGRIVVALWLCGAVMAAALAAITPVLDGALPDTDDYMRFVQVFKWLDDGGWYVARETRVNPPDGLDNHWTRLADIPLAAVVFVAEPWIGRERAVMAAAIAVPGTLLLALVFVLSWAARPLVARRDAGHALLVVFCVLPLVVRYLPGRVDHHGWQLLLLAAALGALVRMAVAPRYRGPAWIGALALAAGLWVGGEVLPWLALLSATLALLWVINGNFLHAGNGFRHAVVLLAACVALLPLALPADRWLDETCDAYGTAYLAFAGFICAFWLGIRLASRRVRGVGARLAVAGVSGGIVSLAFAALFPACLAGPYAAVSPELGDWLAHMPETRSAASLAQEGSAAAVFWLFNPLAAFAVVLVRGITAHGRTRTLWLIHGVFLGAALALAFWQARFLPTAHLLSVIPLTSLLGAIWRRCDARFSVAPRVVAKIATLVLITPLPAILIASASGDDSFEIAGPVCDLRRAAAALNDERTFGDRERRIAGFIDMGPEFLFRTRHSVFAAPYHRNSAGMLVVSRLFTAYSETAASRVAYRHGIDIIALCPGKPEMELYADGSGATFVERLAAGDHPGWLEPIALPGEDGVMLFEVRPQ